MQAAFVCDLWGPLGVVDSSSLLDSCGKFLMLPLLKDSQMDLVAAFKVFYCLILGNFGVLLLAEPNLCWSSMCCLRFSSVDLKNGSILEIIWCSIFDQID